MIRLGGSPAYWILRHGFPRRVEAGNASRDHLEPYADRIVRIVDRSTWESWQPLTVVDFGCGYGRGLINMARQGFQRLIGVDIRSDVLQQAECNAEEMGVGDRCRFTTGLNPGEADVVLSIDAFEHFDDPESVLATMAAGLRPGGRIVASFGPTWYHPRGGHLFSVFPWSHLVFSESSLCRWRRDFRDDGATRFHEVAGGLNQMTICRFEKLVDGSPLQIKQLTLRPIGATRWLHGKWTREFLTSIIDCVMVKPAS